MKFEVTILGSNSATPAYGRNQTSQIININDKLYLVDCGEGTQLQLLRYGIKGSRIKGIFISHLHGDHYLGLVGLISSMHLNGRTEELIIFGPPPLKKIIDIHLKYSDTRLRYPLIFSGTRHTEAEEIYRSESFTVSSFPLNHRVPCTGFMFREVPPLPKLNMDEVTRLNIPTELLSGIKHGDDYIDAKGERHPCSVLTHPPRAARSYAYCSDTLATGSYHPFIKGADLLYHEATFLHEMLERATETYHTTALQAGEIAKLCEVKKMLIGHFSARYRVLDELLAESQSVFGNTELAIEGRCFSVD